MKNTEQPDNINLLIISFLTGSINTQEIESLNHWINAGEKNRAIFNELKDAWIISGGLKDSSRAHSDESWEALKNRINHGALKHVLDKEDKQINYTKYLRVAATWLLIFGLGSALTWWLTDISEEAPVKITYRSVEVSTPLGARSIIFRRLRTGDQNIKSHRRGIF
jgi:hypothetical protein